MAKFAVVFLLISLAIGLLNSSIVVHQHKTGPSNKHVIKNDGFPIKKVFKAFNFLYVVEIQFMYKYI